MGCRPASRFFTTQVAHCIETYFCMSEINKRTFAMCTRPPLARHLVQNSTRQQTACVHRHRTPGWVSTCTKYRVLLPGGCVQCKTVSFSDSTQPSSLMCVAVIKAAARYSYCNMMSVHKISSAMTRWSVANLEKNK